MLESGWQVDNYLSGDEIALPFQRFLAIVLQQCRLSWGALDPIITWQFGSGRHRRLDQSGRIIYREFS